MQRIAVAPKDARLGFQQRYPSHLFSKCGAGASSWLGFAHKPCPQSLRLLKHAEIQQNKFRLLQGCNQEENLSPLPQDSWCSQSVVPALL